MGDWRKTQYRIGPEPDYLAEAEDFKFTALVWSVILVFVVSVVGLLWWFVGLIL